MKKYVLGFLFSNDKRDIALIRKERPEFQKGKFNGVGGKIENDETPLEAMNRECKEEFEINVEWKQYLTIIDKKQTLLYLFKAFDNKIYDLDGLTFNDVMEEIYRFDLYKFNQLGNECMYNLPWMVNMALDDSIQTGIITVDNLKK